MSNSEVDCIIFGQYHGYMAALKRGPSGGCRFRRGGSDATEAAWVSRRGRAGGQRGNGPLERHRCHRLAPGNGPRGTAAWTDIRPFAPCLHADAVCYCPAGAGCDSAGDIRHCRRRCDDRYRYIGVGSTLRCARPAGVLGHGAALCGCVAHRVRDAHDLDRCLRVESEPAGSSVGVPAGPFCGHVARFTAESARLSLSQSNKPRPNPVLRLVSPAFGRRARGAGLLLISGRRRGQPSERPCRGA
jgi:hypothetical protein